MIIIILILWVSYIFILRKKIKEKFVFYKELIPLILINILSSISLGINYLEANFKTSNDGISINNFLVYWIIGEDNWSIELFKSYFENSLYLALFLITLYWGLRFIKKYKNY